MSTKRFCDACGREMKDSDNQKIESRATKPKVRVDILAAEKEADDTAKVTTEKPGDFCLRCVVVAVVDAYNAKKTNGDRVKLVKPRKRAAKEEEAK